MKFLCCDVNNVRLVLDFNFGKTLHLWQHQMKPMYLFHVYVSWCGYCCCIFLLEENDVVWENLKYAIFNLFRSFTWFLLCAYLKNVCCSEGGYSLSFCKNICEHTHSLAKTIISHLSMFQRTFFSLHFVWIQSYPLITRM